jgi:hypothetical protein
MKKYFFCLSFLITLAWGALVAAQNRNPVIVPAPRALSAAAAKADSLLAQEENWDAGELDSFLSDFTTGRGDAISGGELLNRIKSKAAVDSTRMVEGYRIQLLATQDEDEARRARTDARSYFPENSYLLFDDPYYKLRLGDCLTRNSADSLQQRAMGKGFSGAWIVRCLVHEFTPKLNIFYNPPADSTLEDWENP